MPYSWLIVLVICFYMLTVEWQIIKERGPALSYRVLKLHLFFPVQETYTTLLNSQASATDIDYGLYITYVPHWALLAKEGVCRLANWIYQDVMTCMSLLLWNTWGYDSSSSTLSLARLTDRREVVTLSSWTSKETQISISLESQRSKIAYKRGK